MKNITPTVEGAVWAEIFELGETEAETATAAEANAAAATASIALSKINRLRKKYVFNNCLVAFLIVSLSLYQ